MTLRPIIAALLLGSLLSTPGFGFELLDRMLGLQTHDSTATYVEADPHAEPHYVVGEEQILPNRKSLAGASGRIRTSRLYR